MRKDGQRARERESRSFVSHAMAVQSVHEYLHNGPNGLNGLNGSPSRMNCGQAAGGAAIHLCTTQIAPQIEKGWRSRLASWRSSVIDKMYWEGEYALVCLAPSRLRAGASWNYEWGQCKYRLDDYSKLSIPVTHLSWPDHLAEEVCIFILI